MTGPPTDTIVAVATPPGVGALAVFRLSGADAVPILRRLCPGLDADPPPRRATLAGVHDPHDGRLLDRGLVTVFPGPASYTGEDVVEISAHGGFLSASLLLEACTAAGARRAEPGEFTRRAYLHGKLDLVQAEAIADLVEGRSEALRSAALVQLDRGLSGRIASLREDLIGLEALLAHHLDFPDEDEPPVPLGRVVERAGTVAEELARLLETAPEGELLREGALCVLAGRPNAGKSSLFNALLGEQRAIVTEVAGTTRDAIEAVVSLGGFPFRLVDTAGLRDASERVERIGVEVAHRYLERAEVILYCVEAGSVLRSEERAFLEGTHGDVPIVLVRTKSDRIDAGSGSGASGEGADGARAGRPGGDGSFAEVVDTSVECGEGISRLRDVLPRLVFRGLADRGAEAPVLTRRRQARAIREARDEVESFRKALEEGVPAEVACTHLRSAETALEEILGTVTTDDVLDRVFRDFCIGK